MLIANMDGMQFKSVGSDFGDSGPRELFLNILVERAMATYDSSCGDPLHYTASWINDQDIGVEFEAVNQIKNEIEDDIAVRPPLPIKPLAKSIQVAGYTKKDGTVVEPYDRDGDKKADEAPALKKTKREGASLLYKKKSNETDLDFLARVYDAVEEKVGTAETERFLHHLPMDAQKNDREAAAHLQWLALSLSTVLQHRVGSTVDAIDFLPNEALLSRVGGMEGYLDLVTKAPLIHDGDLAKIFQEQHIDTKLETREIWEMASLAAGLELKKNPDFFVDMMSNVFLGNQGDLNMRAIEGVSYAFANAFMSQQFLPMSEPMSDAVLKAASSMSIVELLDTKHSLKFITPTLVGESDGPLKRGIDDMIDNEVFSLRNDLDDNGEPIDPEKALEELNELLQQATTAESSGYWSWGVEVESRIEYFNDKIKEKEQQSIRSALKKQAFANANVTREQQASNDAVLKSQYAEVESRIKEIADGVKNLGNHLSGKDEKDVQTAVRLLSLFPEWNDMKKEFDPDEIPSMIKDWITRAEWEEVTGNPVPEEDIEILRSLLRNQEEARDLLGTLKFRRNSIGTTLRWIKKNSNAMPRFAMERFLKNSNSDMSVDELFELIESEDVSDLLNNSSLLSELMVGNLVDLERRPDGTPVKGLAFRRPDGEIDQSRLELFKGTTSDSDYANAQAIAKEIQSKRSSEIFAERLEAGLLSERTAKRSGDNAHRIKKIAADVWGGWKSSSTTDMGKAMQLAATEEFGCLGKPEYEMNRQDIIDAVGVETYDLIKIHLRATWEATQYLLKTTGKENVVMWRGLQIPDSNLGLSDEIKSAPRSEKFKLDNLKLLRNGLSSATTAADVANNWGGIGEVPENARRVVIRIDAGPEDILSLPVFGDNMHAEQEVVPMGSRWNRWDAWLNVAPDSPDTDWTPEPNESKSMITEVDGERIIEFDGGGGWLEGYGEIAEELEVIGDEAFELADEEDNEEVASVLKSLGQAMIEFTEKKGYVKPYTKEDGTKVDGYHTKKTKKPEEQSSGIDYNRGADEANARHERSALIVSDLVSAILDEDGKRTVARRIQNVLDEHKSVGYRDVQAAWKKVVPQLTVFEAFNFHQTSMEQDTYSGFKNDLIKQMARLHRPLFHHLDLDGNEYDHNEAIQEIHSLLKSPHTTVAFKKFLNSKLEQWEDRKAKYEEQYMQSQVVANASVTRQQQKANDEVLKSQYAAVEDRVAVIAGYVTGGEDVPLALFAGTPDDPAYATAQAIAKTIQMERTDELWEERFPDAIQRPWLNDLAKELWSEWKTSSTTPVGKAMQLAVTDEFGALGKPEYELDRKKIIQEVGEGQYELIKIHLRATWEATQYLLKEAGYEKVVMWRGLQISEADLDLNEKQSKPQNVNLPFVLRNLKLLRNGLSSATTDPVIANDWGGVGDLPIDARRVVIRIDAGPEDILSLPVFGDNIHAEQEVVPMGSRWNRWDAWLNRAPEDPDRHWSEEHGWRADRLNKIDFELTKSMIKNINGELIIEFDGGGGWLEGYGETDSEGESKPSVQDPVRKGMVAGYTKKDGTVVKPYQTSRTKKAEDPSSPRTHRDSADHAMPKGNAPMPSGSISLEKIGDPSPDKIVMNGSDRSTFSEIKKVVIQDLGLDSDLSTLIKAAGVTESAETRVSLIPAGNTWTDNGSSVVLVVSKDGFKNIRAFYKNDNGELVVKNESFKVYEKGQGLGGKMLARQIKHCKDMGVTKMSCNAIRLDSMDPDNFQRKVGALASGYYVWPLLGYDGDINWDTHRDSFWNEDYDTGDYDDWIDLMADAPESVRNAKRVSEVMTTKEGRDWWLKYGVVIDLEFDLSDGSQSMRAFNKYLKRKELLP